MDLGTLSKVHALSSKKNKTKHFDEQFCKPSEKKVHINHNTDGGRNLKLGSSLTLTVPDRMSCGQQSRR